MPRTRNTRVPGDLARFVGIPRSAFVELLIQPLRAGKRGLQTEDRPFIFGEFERGVFCGAIAAKIEKRPAWLQIS